MEAIPLLLFLALLVLPAYCLQSPRQSYHLELARVDAVDTGSLNISDHELLRRAIQRSRDRLASITPRLYPTGNRKVVVGEAPVLSAGGEYLVKLGLGTPQHCFTAAIDTASDLIWTQCQPCVKCYRQKDPVFNPMASTTYAVVPCNSDTCDELDTHRCGRSGSENDDDDDVCQYTYTSAGRLVLGADATAMRNASDRIVVPMSINPRYPSYYYLNLNGLSIGDKAMSSSFRSSMNATTPGTSDANPNVAASPVPVSGDGDGGTGPNAFGMIIDIASTITFLEESLYEELVDDLEEEIRLPRGSGSSLGLDLCFILPNGVPMSRVYAPSMSLAFDGEWLRLEKELLFVEDRESGMMCLMIGKTDGVSILGNYQQQNIQVMYNLRRQRITFVKTNCETLTH
ncbi:aspartyl protease 37-like [Triticum dicoccoides]|uniref:aspartyl protease 37-like n=1 Tax=Triticum dicoccoides TaxID=85692 RepID=UPI00188FA394|nr:aspartyl protease 37-like [Triticum dicoccoides]